MGNLLRIAGWASRPFFVFCLMLTTLAASIDAINPLVVHAEQFRGVLQEDSLDEVRPYLLEPISVWLARGFFIAKTTSNLDFPLGLGSYPAGLADEEYQGILTKFFSSELLDTKEQQRLATFLPYSVPVEMIGNEVSPKQVLFYSKLSQRRIPKAIFEFNMHWFSAQTVTKQASGYLYRRFGLGNITESDTTAADGSNEVQENVPSVFFTELFQLHQPAVAAGYSQLFKFNSDNTKSFYLFSPVIGKLRQLPLSIRSDAILQGQLSPNDIGVFSEDLATIEADFISEKEVLTFFGSATALPLDSTDEQSQGPNSLRRIEGSYTLLSGSNSMARWNGEQRQFSQFVPWMSLSSVASLRTLLLFEIRPRDPFSNYGKAFVFLDKESLLPVYKLVYSKWGSLDRVVIGNWLAVQDKSSDKSYPVLSSVVSISANGGQATSLSISSVEFVENVDAQHSSFAQWEKQLEPTKLGQLAQDDIGSKTASSATEGTTETVKKAVATLPSID